MEEKRDEIFQKFKNGFGNDTLEFHMTYYDGFFKNLSIVTKLIYPNITSDEILMVNFYLNSYKLKKV